MSAFFWQHSSGWEEVGMGHKSVRQLYFIEDEIDAVDVYNRLRSHPLIIEYPLQLNPAFSSLAMLKRLVIRNSVKGQVRGQRIWTTTT
jgi:hypothetical protein